MTIRPALDGISGGSTGQSGAGRGSSGGKLIILFGKVLLIVHFSTKYGLFIQVELDINKLH